MVVHLVLFQFKPETRDQLDEAVARLKAMAGQVDVIRDLKAGRDVLHSGRSFDLGLCVTFDDRKGLEIYDEHPNHLPVKAFLRPLLERSVAVDFEA